MNEPEPSLDPYLLTLQGVENPPTSWWSALRKVGPGILLAGTIVGSGELILTTSFGASYGFAFLWLILFSCAIKVFVQIELGRFTISGGQPTLSALDQIGHGTQDHSTNDLNSPHPRMASLRLGRWLVWWWFLMLLCTVFQLGGMLGAVGQAMHAAWPSASPWILSNLSNIISVLSNDAAKYVEYPWAIFACGIAMALIYGGSYQRLERLTTWIVIGLTLLTVLAAISLQWTDFAYSWSEVAAGLKPTIPTHGVADAFAIFGITGVGATELFYYPYWCLEKGYARYVGPRDGSLAWEQRAKGWIRVMYLDAWVSMVVFTVSTVSFYILGAAVLHPQGLVPQKSEMLTVLSQMFGKPFGPLAQMLFYGAAGIVLLKTLYLACAANSRLTVDFLQLHGLLSIQTLTDRMRWISRFCLFFPLLALGFYLFARDPQWMVKVGGIAQASTLPMIGAATLYFRYRRLDPKLKPSKAWDTMLWIAILLIVAVACYAIPSQIGSLFTSQGK